MVTDQQVRRLRQKIMDGSTQAAAAAAAGMSVRSARNWQRGGLPSEQHKGRDWRTRADPFDGVWNEIEAFLREDHDGALMATTILDWLEEKYPGRFSPGQVRSLQRRFRDWRAVHGPDQEVFFPQEHPPGREAQLDFTHCQELGVTIAGEPFPHLLFEFILSHSGWRYVDLAMSETLEALVKGLQGSLWELGGAPQVVRSDSLSAATHELRYSRGRAFNERYGAVLAHYGIRPTATNANSPHENGVAEQAHYRLKSALDQAIFLRGSRDFPTIAAYMDFVRETVRKRNKRTKLRFNIERQYLRPLPPAPIPEYTTYRPKVSKWSIIRVARRSYTVPARLQGMEVEVRQYADHLEVYYRDHLVADMERLHGTTEAKVDYRHIIHSLVRKPGAFARYRFREQLFPTQTFRFAYDAICRWRGERADVEYVRILHLAATTMESDVERALSLLLEDGRPFGFLDVRDLAAPVTPQIPFLISLTAPDLKVYDALLAGGVR
ncbi:MAG: IS21 family transposase [Dehalococcoidales bacterium]|nr:IS21 family transposase [Dehalococcoidales bacterium]